MISVFRVALNKKGLKIETFRFYDEYDYGYEIFLIQSSARHAC